jgi:hypothetical protein
MNRRRVLRLVPPIVLLGGALILIPGTPLYVVNWVNSSAQYQGHSTHYWVQALDSPDAEVRHEAIHALGAIGPAAAAATPTLAAILVEDPDRHARREAALALWKMDPDPDIAVPALARALEDKEPWIRMNAAIGLFRLRGGTQAAIPVLIRALQDKQNKTNLEEFLFTIQEMSALALGRASAGSPLGVPALVAALKGADTDSMRRTAARALGSVGAEAQAAVPLLRAMLNDEDVAAREAAEEALQKIEGKTTPAGKDSARDLELPEAQRAYLWDIEHHGNLLAKYGFGPFAQALKNADGPALARLLADGFTGTDLREPRRVRAVADFGEVERLQDAGQPPVPHNRDTFVARLLEFRKAFGKTAPQVKLALMTLSPKVRGHLDEAWEGTAQLRLAGEHAPGAPAEVVVLLHYELGRPTEETLSRPGWLRAAGVLQVLSARAPHYLFADVTRQRRLDASKLHDNWKHAPLHPSTGGVYVCDFDRDGILDVLVTDITGNALYRGRADGTFELVTVRCGLPSQLPGHPVAAWVDLDGDGWEDLILAGRIYRNEAGQRFVDYTDRCNLNLPADTGTILAADYDRDGKLDLYVTRRGRQRGTSWLDGRSGDPRGNYLFRNRGNWQFEDVTLASGTMGGQRSTFTAAWLDANNDGWPDLHVPNEFGDGVLLINNRDGTFSEHALADRPADFGTMGMAVGDVDNDGNIDIYCANMYSKAGSRVIGNLAPDAYPPDVLEKMRRFVAGSQLHLNKGGLKFEQVGKQMQVAGVGWAYGTCLADLDNDGWLDIYATAGFVSKNRDDPDG